MASRGHAKAVNGVVPTVIGNGVVVDPFDVAGGLLGFAANTWANHQLDKIRRPTSEDDKAMKLNEDTLKTLDARIQTLNTRKQMVSAWRASVKEKTKSPPAPFFPGITIRDVQKGSIVMYENLQRELPKLRDDVSAFLAAGGERKAGKAKAQELRTLYNTLLPHYRLWYNNVQELDKWQDDVYEEWAADEQDAVFARRK